MVVVWEMLIGNNILIDFYFTFVFCVSTELAVSSYARYVVCMHMYEILTVHIQPKFHSVIEEDANWYSCLCFPVNSSCTDGMDSNK